MIKKMNAAGTFYPAKKDELEELFKNYTVESPKYYSRAIIIPHAGYKYSGQLAAKGIQQINKAVKNIFIFAPAHYERIFGCSLCKYNAFETPFGEIEVNQTLTKEIAKLCDCNTSNFAFEKEHSIEVQLPLIKYFLPNAKIVPVLYGCENFKNLSETIEHFYEDEDNAFIISSDLSHFYPEKEASKIDNYTAKMIEENNLSNFEQEQACGAVGICGLIEFAKKKDYSLIRKGLINSAAATGDSSRVVGYGCWILYDGEKNQYIKKYYSDFVRKICSDSILSGLQLGHTEVNNYKCIFDEYGASFVTLELNGILRGCIGSIIPHRSLINDLIKNAHAAAFSDPRFPALTLNEFNKINIKVSLLSIPERFHFDTEEELLQKLKPYEDGLIIRDGNYQAVFLPDVWEQLPDKKDFFEQLKLKAGLPKNYFSESLEAFKFSTTKI